MIVPGKRLLMVTLCGASWRATPATKPVRARRGREIELFDRHAHGERGDVDDAPKPACGHRVGKALDEMGCRKKVGFHGARPVLAGKLAEVFRRRTPAIGDENVRRPRFTDQARALAVLGEIGDVIVGLALCCASDARGGALQRLAIARD
jgi:hypothetical protein